MFNILFLLMSISVLPALATVRPAVQKYHAGEILVKFAMNRSSAFERQAQIKSMGAKAVKSVNPDGLVHIKTRLNQTVEEAVAEYQKLASVEYAQPNFRYQKSAAPNDPQYMNQWAWKNTGQKITSGNYTAHNPGLTGKDLGLEGAWDLITDCSAITVAVVDTGINYTHSDLVANMWNGGTAYPNHGYNFINSNNDPMDLDGHGTHVAGIVGAVGNNGIGTTGVCWRASLMAVRVLDSSGSGSTVDIVSGVDFAVANGAKVINLSLGQSSLDPALETSIVNAANHGVIVVVAAGNDGINNDGSGTPTYPCNFHQPNLICVAALDQAFHLAAFSNYGEQSVAVGAPGTNFTSLWAGSNGVLSDSFNTNGSMNWTRNNTSAWGYSQQSLSQGSTSSILSSPSNWDRSTTKYPNNLDARVRKKFNLAGVSSAVVDFWAYLDTETAHDFFRVGYETAGGDPFTSGLVIDQESGSSQGAPINLTFDISGCRTSQCSLGFQLTSDASGTDFGVGIFDFMITTLTINTNSYRTIDGTSMATPVVSGLVAMVLAYNPDFTIADAIRAVESGGRSVSDLFGKTSSGNGVHALGALSYIAPPSGVTTVVH